MLSVSPAAYISAMAAVIDTGIPAATQKRGARVQEQEQQRRRPAPGPSARCRAGSSSRPVICSARVRIRSIVTPAGSVALHLGRDLLDRCAGCRSRRPGPSGRPGPRPPGRRRRSRRASRSTPSTRTVGHVADGQRRCRRGSTRRTMPAISSAERFSTPVRTRAAPATSPAGSASASRGDGVGDLGMVDVVADQRQRRHLDDRLGRGDALDRGARHALGEQPRDELVGEAAPAGRRPPGR